MNEHEKDIHDFIKSICPIVVWGRPGEEAYCNAKYVTISIGGITIDGFKQAGADSASAAVKKMKMHIKKYCLGKKRVILRREAEVEEFHGRVLANIRLFADDGDVELV